MSEQGEKTCPLCTEEMDLTDQQLKPCKCGYEICVWCWHHIMDMAEKEETGGRCPACRVPYDKERIVGMAANCERLITEVNTEKKSKLQKAKNRTADGRKQLSSLRVIQRNLVYIVGLPINLADEDLLQRKEYFGQYGRVLKVSISRTSGGSIQHFQNNTCSVYITYSKEDEAIRCIQTVHGFILEGRPLRACFGTTKYCHAWLRNMPCNNPDCLYLHEIGPPEDSFSKDEIISEYTRSRVQQITTTTCNQQRRSGNVLPPPPDDSLPTTSKPISKTASNSIACTVKASLPSDNSTKTAALPATASWGTRASNSNSVVASMSCSDGRFKHKSDGLSVSPPIRSSDCRTQISKLNTTGKGFLLRDNVQTKNKLELFQSMEKNSYDFPVMSDDSGSTCGILGSQTFFHSGYGENNGAEIGSLMNNLSGPRVQFTGSDPETGVDFTTKKIGNICSVMSSMSIDHDRNDTFGPIESNYQYEQSALSNFPGVRLDLRKLHEGHEMRIPQQDQRSDSQLIQNGSGSCFPESCKNSLLRANEGCEHLIPCISNNNTVLLNRSLDYHTDIGQITDDLCSRQSADLGESEFVAAKDLGEHSIISNILSLDSNAWDDFASSGGLVSLLQDKEKHTSPLPVSSSWRPQNVNKSRFSFAREEESRSLSSEQGVYFDNHPKPSMFDHFGQNLSEDHKPRSSSILSSSYTEQPAHFTSNHSIRNAGSRAQVSTPPGFSVPSRAPPGFFSPVGTESTHVTGIGAHFPDNTPLSRNIIQAEEPLNMEGNDIGINDPAILAIGKESVPCLLGCQGLDTNSLSNPLIPFENDAHLQFLMQRPFMQHLNTRFPEVGNKYSALSDFYTNNISALAQGSVPRSAVALLSNGVWDPCDPWNEIDTGNTLGISELMRNERLGFRGLYTGREDSGFQMSKSSDF